MKHYFTFLFLLSILITFDLYGQDDNSNDIYFEVNRVCPAFSITKQKIVDADSLINLNPHYKPDWVRSYISVEITTINNKVNNITSGDSDKLTKKQKSYMESADPGSDISIVIKYIPENDLKINEPKITNFTLIVDPDNEAEFVGGSHSLKTYIKDFAISKIPEGTFTNNDFSTVKFTVDEDGHIVDAHVFWPSDKEHVDAIMLEAVCNMPAWNPASYDNGHKVKQEFALIVGNMNSCVLPLLNFKKN